MKKRNIIKNLLLLSVIALSTACNSLDQDPSDQHTDDTFWQSEANSELLVNTAYAQMYGADKMWNDEALADNVIQARTDNDQRKMRNGLATSSLGIYGSEWKWAYEGIKTCHKYLENIDRVPNMEASLKNTRKAEIRYIRASLFMRLAYFYGDVPFFTKDITLEEAKTIKRTSKSTILSFVHQELDEIINVLPAKSSSVTKGRITKAAATALQARAYLYESNWAMVEKYTSSLINEQSVYGNYSLFNDYETLFQSQNNYNDEVILECGFATSNRSWGEMRSRVPLSQGANLNACAPIQELVDSYLTVNGKSIKNDPTYNAANPYENRDPRFVASIVYDGFVWGKDSEGKDIIIRTAYGTGTADSWESVSSNRSVTGYYIRKYYDPESRKTLKDYQQTNNIIMLRYADVLLMYAEAMFEQGKMSENVWNQTIKKIRSRAGFTEATALNYPSVSDSDMRELLHNERRTELVFEGLRYYDIVRWKAGTTLLNKTVHGAKFASNNTAYITLDTWKFDEGRDYLWSVPMEQMVMNPNLKPNNPGY